jgi:hypothetical protein
VLTYTLLPTKAEASVFPYKDVFDAMKIHFKTPMIIGVFVLTTAHFYGLQYTMSTKTWAVVVSVYLTTTPRLNSNGYYGHMGFSHICALLNRTQLRFIVVPLIGKEWVEVNKVPTVAAVGTLPLCNINLCPILLSWSGNNLIIRKTKKAKL